MAVHWKGLELSGYSFYKLEYFSSINVPLQVWRILGEQFASGLGNVKILNVNRAWHQQCQKQESRCTDQHGGKWSRWKSTSFPLELWRSGLAWKVLFTLGEGLLPQLLLPENTLTDLYRSKSLS